MVLPWQECQPEHTVLLRDLNEGSPGNYTSGDTAPSLIGIRYLLSLLHFNVTFTKQFMVLHLFFLNAHKLRAATDNSLQLPTEVRAKNTGVLY